MKKENEISKTCAQGFHGWKMCSLFVIQKNIRKNMSLTAKKENNVFILQKYEIKLWANPLNGSAGFPLRFQGNSLCSCSQNLKSHLASGSSHQKKKKISNEISISNKRTIIHSTSKAFLQEWSIIWST